MSDHPTPRQALLDALVYAPAGLVLTVVEELPQLAEKGRRRIEGRITTARVVGQFAVQFARQQVAQRRDGGGWLPGMPGSRPPAPPAGSQAPSPTGTGAAPGSAGEPSGAAPSDEAPVIEAPVRRPASRPSRPAGGRAASGPTGSKARRPPAGTPGAAGPTGRSHAAGRAPAAGDGGVLGIPGYDSLSASQVVQRLAGLTPAELQAVRRHEAAGRHRRTILNRADQLLGGGTRDGAQAAHGGRDPATPGAVPGGATSPPAGG